MEQQFTLSVKVFNDTNLKDSTGSRVPLCPRDSSSFGVKIITVQLTNFEKLVKS